MKRTIISIITIACTLTAQAQFSGQGSGTEKDPYQITNADELFDVRNDLSAYYKVMNDIDLTEWIQDESPKQGWAPIGTETTPFTGTFEGNNKSIIGLYINKPNVDNIGLFGYIKECTIKNISLLNPVVIGNNAVGAIVGGGMSTKYYCINDNICIGGKITGKSYIGGIAGRISGVDGTSDNICYLKGNYSSSDVLGNDCCGGIVGEVCGYNQTYNSSYTHIHSHCYPLIYDNHYNGIIEGNSNVGGIVGRESNPKTDWYYGPLLQMETKRNLARGTIIGKNDTNGLLGYADNTAQDYFIFSFNICAADTILGTSPNRIFSKAYADNYAWTETIVIKNGKVVDVDDDNFNGSSLGSKTLMRKNTYVGMGFDFNEQWAISEGETFPYNINQSAPGKITEFTGGSRGKITGTANGTGTVYVFIGDKMYKSFIVDGQWEVTLPNTTVGTEAKVVVATNGLMPSLFVKAIAEEGTTPTPQGKLGDANGDGMVDASDVTAIINYILGKPSASFNKKNADVTGDSEILIDDAVHTVQMIMDAQ